MPHHITQLENMRFPYREEKRATTAPSDYEIKHYEGEAITVPYLPRKGQEYADSYFQDVAERIRISSTVKKIT